MTAMTDSGPRVSDLPAGKAIHCILPNDGTHKRVLVELREKYGIVSAGSATRRGVAALAEAKTKPGKLPEPVLVRELHVICSEDEADEIFDFIFWLAELDKPGRGIVWQQPVTGRTPYEMPTGLPNEDSDD